MFKKGDRIVVDNTDTGDASGWLGRTGTVSRRVDKRELPVGVWLDGVPTMFWFADSELRVESDAETTEDASGGRHE